jgi:hypothetical protein
MTEKHFEAFDRLIEDAFSNAFQKDRTGSPDSRQADAYESIDDYTNKTGKRFRMLKEQKDRGLTRDQAFDELYGDLN